MQTEKRRIGRPDILAFVAVDTALLEVGLGMEEKETRSNNEKFS